MCNSRCYTTQTWSQCIAWYACYSPSCRQLVPNYTILLQRQWGTRNLPEVCTLQLSGSVQNARNANARLMPYCYAIALPLNSTAKCHVIQTSLWHVATFTVSQKRWHKGTKQCWEVVWSIGLHSASKVQFHCINMAGCLAAIISRHKKTQYSCIIILPFQHTHCK